MSSRLIKRSFLYVARALGAFRLSRYLTRHQLRILCYHGFSVGDEFVHHPSMFMRAETFKRRMRMLVLLGFPVISLDEAVDKLGANQIRNAEIVLTFDDGWASNLSIAYPILKAHQFPATIYVTTEHLAASTEVFNVVLYHLFVTSALSTFELTGIHPAIDGSYRIKPDPTPAVQTIIRAARQHLSLAQRQVSLGRIATTLGLDIDRVLEGHRFRLVTAAEMRELARAGVAIELHTHTHDLPADSFDAMRAEITQNRDAIEAVTGTKARHFCYPSGRYSAWHPEWLASLGIKSGTTCDSGLNDATTNMLLLRRYLDQENFSEIEFEASITGFSYLVRRFLRLA